MKDVPDRLDKGSGSGCWSRRSGVAALGVLFLPAIAAAAEPVFGDLPADIAKERPSASVPADLPGSRTDPCAVYAGVRVFVPLRGVLVEPDPAALAGAGGNGCAGPSAAASTGSSGEQPSGDAGE